MKEEDVNIIEMLLFNILSTVNGLLLATVKNKKGNDGLLRQVQDTHNLLTNINIAKKHKETCLGCYGCKYFDLNCIATMCRLDLNSNFHRMGCGFRKESEADK